jgi:DNA-directed RNA polymerase omega subunit
MTEFSIEELSKKTDNIYESVVVMCKRARQIINEQKLQIDMEKDHVNGNDNLESEDFEDVEIDREALMKEHKKYPKPSKLAIKEMVKGKTQFEYKSSEEKD